MEDLIWINGKKYSTSKCDPNIRLSDFIRDHAKLKGTKTTCREGGCGTCIVTVTRKYHLTGKEKTSTLNSCLCPLHTVTDSHVTTVEGLGNHHDGFHPIQKSIAAFNGSQCGYCTPGMVMNMYGLFCNGQKPTDTDIERSFDGNLCRCTGYRSILDSAKDLAKSEGGQHVLDIEDLHRFKCGHIESTSSDQIVASKVFNGRSWYSPTNLTQLYGLYEKHKGQSVRLVFGNTSTGIQQVSCCDVYISVRHVQELNLFKLNKNEVEIGANTTIQDIIDVFKSPEFLKNKNTEVPPGLRYLKHVLVPYLEKLGSLAIRNAGSCAGNLMLKHKDRLFPSDLFTPLEALQAKIKIGNHGGINMYSPVEFLDVDMSDKVIISIIFPAIDPETERFQTFKVMPRAANAYAYVNASFYVKLDNTKVLDARLAFGGMASSYHRARKTEALLKKRSYNKDTLKAVYECLEEEIQYEENRVLPSGNYRRGVARNLLHLFLINACNSQLSVEQFYEYTRIKQWTSSANYDFETKEEEYPYCQPMPKLDSCLQASGEAEFIGDKPKCDNEVHAVCVTSDHANADVTDIDTSEAENLPGVCAVITAKNMTGIKNKCPLDGANGQSVLLVENHVDYAGQPIAIVVADTVEVARIAAKLVKVKYTNIQKPILSIEDAIEKNSFHPNQTEFPLEVSQGDADTAYRNSDHQLTGEVSVGTQYHFYMENQIAYCIPYDDMLDIWLSTQTLTFAQHAITELLGLPHASVNVKALRIGGGFGGKSANAVFVGSVCALAAKIVKRPVRFALSLSECMKMLGKRFAVMAKYKVGVSADGNINAIIMDYYHDSGCISSGFFASGYSHMMCSRSLTIMDNGYRVPHWKLNGYVTRTNRFPTTTMRGPDHTPTAFTMEYIMDHVASTLKTDPILLKEMHLLHEGGLSLKGTRYKEVTLSKMWHDLKQEMDIDKRQAQIKAFNEANRYKKKGLSMIPSKMFVQYSKTHAYNAYVTVYSGDGTVAITHGAIEMGQGLNTKVIQVAAKSLGVSVGDIKVHTTATLTAADSPGTYGSLGSDCVCRSVLECCNRLKEKMNPIKDKHPEASWKELVLLCYQEGVDMAVSYKFTAFEHPHGCFAYCVFGVCAIEAEVDILTGENVVSCVDALFDIGESANPTIDIGQIEGALVMGLGYYRSEKEVHEPQTGVLLTDGTWEYKIPTAKDIPVKMNIKLLKKAKNNLGVMPSKAIGEPPIVSTPAVVFAIKQAIASYREEHGDTDWFSAKQPMTVDTIQEMCNVTAKHLLGDMEA